jgi:plasmid maintenance system antidote protein VapI
MLLDIVAIWLHLVAMTQRKPSPTDQVPPTAAALLTRKIEDMGLSKTQAAEMIKADRSSLYRWLTGARSPHVEVAARIEDAFGISARLWGVYPSKAA